MPWATVTQSAYKLVHKLSIITDVFIYTLLSYIKMTVHTTGMGALVISVYKMYGTVQLKVCNTIT